MHVKNQYVIIIAYHACQKMICNILDYYAPIPWFIVLQGCHDYNIQAPWVLFERVWFFLAMGNCSIEWTIMTIR
jgi:hypothetical protein